MSNADPLPESNLHPRIEKSLKESNEFVEVDCDLEDRDEDEQDWLQGKVIDNKANQQQLNHSEVLSSFEQLLDEIQGQEVNQE